MKPFVEASFLITEEDFVRMSLERKQDSILKDNKIILKAMGLIAVCSGAAAFVIMGGSIYQRICWLILIAIGLYAVSYYDVIVFYMTRKSSVVFYGNNKKSIESQNVRLYEDKFEISSENRKIKVPLKYIYRITEGKNTILVYTDREELFFLPKRIISDPQIQKLRDIAKDKYRIL